MTLVLDALTRSDCERVRVWRNLDENRLHLRTPYVLTEEMQARFYEDVVCNRNAPHRYWALRVPSAHPVQPAGYGAYVGALDFVGMAGLTDIDWVNGHAEISLLLAPEAQGKGYGTAAVELVLREAFERMRLATVYAEAYETNPNLGFWRRMAEKHPGAGSTVIPRRKFWDGRLHGALLFWFVAPEPVQMTLAERTTQRFQQLGEEIRKLQEAERVVDAEILAHGGPVAAGMMRARLVAPEGA